MYSLAILYTRYPEPTSEMLDRAEAAQREALEVFRAEHADYEAGLVTMALGNNAFRRQRWKPGEHGGRHYLGDSYAITYTPGLRP
jgi:hypothetical protein